MPVGGVLATPETAEKIEKTLTLTQDTVPDELKPKFADRFKQKRTLAEVMKESRVEDPFAGPDMRLSIPERDEAGDPVPSWGERVQAKLNEKEIER